MARNSDDVSNDADDTVEGATVEDDAILEPMTDDVDSILANAGKNGESSENNSEVSTAEDVRSSVENSAALTDAEAEKNLAAYFGETTPSPTTSSSDDDEKKSDANIDEKTSTEEAKKRKKKEEEASEAIRRRNDASAKTPTTITPRIRPL